MLDYADFIAITSENLRLYRKIYGLTQDDVSEAIMLGHTTYAGIENGKTCIGFYNAYLLSSFYGTRIENIWDADLRVKFFSQSINI